MKFSKSWLGEWVGPIQENEKLFHQLTMAGLEVDGYEDLKEGLSGVVVAEIKNVTPVENSDHLKCCQVSWGNKIVQVVCGASNVALPSQASAAVPLGRASATMTSTATATRTARNHSDGRRDAARRRRRRRCNQGEAEDHGLMCVPIQ